MAVGLPAEPELLSVAGIRLGVAELGGRTRARADLTVMEVAPGARASAVFTRNAFCAAPVLVARRHLAAAAPRYLLINAGNANAGTGARGEADAIACCEALAGRAGCAVEAVLPFSTGVIGEPLAIERFPDAIGAALADLAADGWSRAARAIMTTDTLPKGCSTRVSLGGASATITGIVKGAGMIRPNMATMLAFLATDADVPAITLDASLRAAVEASFNRITIDGDTSTNDACVLVATGAARGARVDEHDMESVDAFAAALADVCTRLAHGIVRDAEGATKFVAVRVTEGRDEDECLTLGFAIAHSPLVKTAIYACDANWGRILAVVGRAGLADLDISRVCIELGDTTIVEHGARAAGYREEDGQRAMAPEELAITVRLGRGDADATVWTSDLSHEYVSINASYRT